MASFSYIYLHGIFRTVRKVKSFVFYPILKINQNVEIALNGAIRYPSSNTSLSVDARSTIGEEGKSVWGRNDEME